RLLLSDSARTGTAGTDHGGLDEQPWWHRLCHHNRTRRLPPGRALGCSRKRQRAAVARGLPPLPATAVIPLTRGADRWVQHAAPASRGRCIRRLDGHRGSASTTAPGTLKASKEGLIPCPIASRTTKSGRCSARSPTACR